MDGGVREIQLTKGYVAIVDAADFESLSRWSWSANPKPHIGRHGHPVTYAQRGIRAGGRNTTLTISRQIMGAGPGQIVDHINGDPLDNRRANLRFATPYQNAVNRGALGTNKCGYIGVRINRSGRTYYAEIRHHGRLFCARGFSLIEDAARAYDAMARRLRGDFAVLNFPEAA